MGYLILCIAANVGIFTCFRAFKKYGLNTFEAIVFNYLVCVCTGVLFAGSAVPVLFDSHSMQWIPYASGLGIVFIGTFYLMARTTQVFSMTVSSVATKMSLVIPVLFSLLILDIQSRDYSFWNYSGMLLALAAILASSYKPDKTSLSASNFSYYLLPVSIFVLGGIIDSTINFVSFRFLTGPEEQVFPIVIFFCAGVAGLAVLLFRRQVPHWRNMLGGAVLGMVNYFSVYYLVRSLSAFQHDGALVYPMINVGIILFSSLVSGLFFREKFSRINLAGVLLAILAIFFLSHQEILGVLFS